MLNRRLGAWGGALIFLAAALAGCSSDPAATTPPNVLSFRVTDRATGALLPAKVVLRDEAGNVIGIGTRDMYNGADQDLGYCNLGEGVLGTAEGLVLADGTGDLPIAGNDGCTPTPAVGFGRVEVLILHGIEYEMFVTSVDLEPGMGRIEIQAPLERAWTAEGALAADLHVHTDQSGDSRVPRSVRVLTELVTGVQVIGASDHNMNGTFDDDIDALQLRGQIAAIDGNEVSADMVHANVFPAYPDETLPRGGASAGEEVGQLTGAGFFAHLRALPDHPLVQLNHPRLRYAAYFDYAGWDGKTWPPPMPMDFDSFEVLQGMMAFNVDGDRRVDQAIGDLYTMIEHGKLAAAVGNSDTHHLSGVLAGVPRNYVFVDDTRLEPFDESGFLDAIRARHVVATTGPWLEVHTGDGAGSGGMTVPQGGNVSLAISLRQAAFVHTNRIRVWVGNQVAMTLTVDPAARNFDWTGSLPVGASDTWIGVDAMGDDPLPEVLTGTFIAYQSQGKGMAPVALINPILVDADGNGVWSPAAAAAAKVAAVPDILPPPWTGRPQECGQPPPLPLR